MTNKSIAWHASIVGQVLAVACAFLFLCASARAGEKVILHFNQTQGAFPISGLTSDGAGNLYGTTSAGGKFNCGTAFELSPGSGGKWIETVLYDFDFQNCQILGPTPFGTMVFDQAGNLFGTEHGYFNGNGLIFELSKGTNGTWSEKVVHLFQANSEGSPYGDLTWDSAGNLYGTTSWDSTAFDGEAFRLSPQADGTWKKTVLYTFPAPNGVGYPESGPIMDSKGNLYGITFFGSAGYGSSAVYELSPQAGGPWTLTVVYNFTSGTNDPNSRLTFDSSGNLYGTALLPENGRVFKLSPNSDGTWSETTIHAFNSVSDGRNPFGVLVFDANGNLYGTTQYGGSGCNGALCGVVYRLTPQSDGSWKEAVVHAFDSAEDGSQPQQGLMLDSSGNLFGTTYRGGSRYGYGTVFEIKP